MRTTRVHVAAFLVLILFGVGRALSARNYEGQFERALKVTVPAEVEVTTGSGNIAVRTGDASTVRVRGMIHVDSGVGEAESTRKLQQLENNPPIQQTGALIRIGRIQDPELRRHVSISYEVVVPAETRLKSDTGSGDQTIDGVRGSVKATTGSGNLRLSHTSNEARLNAGSGNVEINSVSGAVYAETGSGNIRAVNVSGSVRAHTGSGDVRLEQTGTESVAADTGSGNVEVSGVRGPLRAHTGSGEIRVNGDPTGDWKLDTGSGNVTMRLSAQSSFNLHAHTGSGDIHSNQPITVQGKISRTELRGVVRNGGPLVELGTGSGNIRIE